MFDSFSKYELLKEKFSLNINLVFLYISFNIKFSEAGINKTKLAIYKLTFLFIFEHFAVFSNLC